MLNHALTALSIAHNMKDYEIDGLQRVAPDADPRVSQMLIVAKQQTGACEIEQQTTDDLKNMKPGNRWKLVRLIMQELAEAKVLRFDTRGRIVASDLYSKDELLNFFIVNFYKFTCNVILNQGTSRMTSQAVAQLMPAWALPSDQLTNGVLIKQVAALVQVDLDERMKPYFLVENAKNALDVLFKLQVNVNLVVSQARISDQELFASSLVDFASNTYPQGLAQTCVMAAFLYFRHDMHLQNISPDPESIRLMVAARPGPMSVELNSMILAFYKYVSSREMHETMALFLRNIFGNEDLVAKPYASEDFANVSFTRQEKLAKLAQQAAQARRRQQHEGGGGGGGGSGGGSGADM